MWVEAQPRDPDTEEKGPKAPAASNAAPSASSGAPAAARGVPAASSLTLSGEAVPARAPSAPLGIPVASGGAAAAPARASADPAPARAGADLASADWVRLVDRIKSDDPRGMEELYSLFAQGVRFYLCRQLGPQDLDDRVHDTFVIVVQAIRREELREPERLLGFVRTIVRRQVAAQIDEVVSARRDCPASEPGVALRDHRMNPEASAIEQEHEKIVERILRGISRRDREILTRFYLLEETQEQICADMGLSENQFRLLKSRAKARFSELGRRRLTRRRFF